MQKRRVTNHNDKYVLFYEFGESDDETDEVSAQR